MNVRLKESSEYHSFSGLLLVLGDLLEEGVDDGDCEHDTGTAADGTHKVSKDAESTDADTAEGCSDMDIARQVLDHGLFAETFNGHVLIHEVSDNITRCLS